MRIGPQHPALYGALAVRLDLDADTVKGADIDVGFEHEGLEKLAESMTFEEGIKLADRIHSGHAPASALSYVLACEQLVEIVPPRRAQVLRVILAELTRLQEHLVWMRRQALAAGADAVATATSERCATIDQVLAEIVGDRHQRPLLKIGGLTRDVTETSIEGLNGILDELPQFVSHLERNSAASRLFARRLRGTGKVEPREAVACGLTGPALRATGVPYDVRKARPYSGYERYDFAVPTQEGGDSWARFLQRLQECRESLRIIAQARDDLPRGAVDIGEEDEAQLEGPSTLTGQEIYSSTEAPAGELGFFLVAGDRSKPYRVRVRSPSLYHAALLHHLLVGENVADVAGVIASFALVVGEIDR